MKDQRETTVSDVLRPLKLAILFSVLGEAVILLFWGVILHPDGNMLHKFLWTIIFCGIGMGATTGAFIDFLVVGKLKGISAIVGCVVISIVLLGLSCNFLCHNLDMYFNFFGGSDTPDLFIWNGIIMSAFGGAIVGWLCFTEKGISILDRYKI